MLEEHSASGSRSLQKLTGNATTSKMYIQELVDAWSGEAPRQGDDEELDLMVENYLSRFYNAAPEYDPEEYSDWSEWLERQREKFYTDRDKRRLMSSNRRERGYGRVRRIN